MQSLYLFSQTLAQKSLSDLALTRFMMARFTTRRRVWQAAFALLLVFSLVMLNIAPVLAEPSAPEASPALRRAPIGAMPSIFGASREPGLGRAGGTAMMSA